MPLGCSPVKGRPFGFAVDKAGKVWTIENIGTGATFEKGVATIHYSKWNLIE